MPRKPRIHFAGATYHAMARGVEGRPIFIDDSDRLRFMGELRRYEQESGSQILAYCLMSNHFHLAIRVALTPLGAFMRRLMGGYASTFNHRYDRLGHLFQARHKANLCLDDRYLATLIHYIHMNPVRAGLVSSPHEWRWSSFKPTNHSLPNLNDFDPWNNDDQMPNLNRTILTSLPLDSIGASTSTQSGVTIEKLRAPGREAKTVSARRQFVLEAIRNGHTLAAAARWLRTTRSTVGRYAVEVTQQREVWPHLDAAARMRHPSTQ
jgi:REP element-mobilizing transposase RayT